MDLEKFIASEERQRDLIQAIHERATDAARCLARAGVREDVRAKRNDLIQAGGQVAQLQGWATLLQEHIDAIADRPRPVE